MKKILFILGAVMVSSALAAQTPLSLEQYRRNVLDYSQEVKKAKEGVVSAEAQVKAAKTGFIPKLDASLDFNYMVKKISFELGPGAMLSMKPYTYGVNVNAAQNVYAGGLVKKQVNLLETSRDIAGLTQDVTKENIVYAAEMNYWNASAMVSFLDMARQYLRIVKDNYDVVEKKFDDGLISKTDLLMVDTRLKEAEYQLADAEKMYKQAIINLNVLMGAPVDNEVAIVDSIMLDAVSLPELENIGEVLAAKPEYRIAQKSILANEQKLKLTKAGYLPQVAVGFTGQYATKSLNIDGKGMWNGIAFAQVKVPIFSGNERKHKTAVDKSNIRTSEYERQMVIDDVTKQIANAWSNLKESYSQLGIARKNLDIAEESLSLNMYSYNEGLLTILDVLSAQMSWLGAYNNLITTNMNYRTAFSDYQKAVGAFAAY